MKWTEANKDEIEELCFLKSLVAGYPSEGNPLLRKAVINGWVRRQITYRISTEGLARLTGLEHQLEGGSKWT
jgi:hypothetical protein